MNYKASIGKSSYDIPYNSEDDLPLLRNLCSKVNIAVNSVLSTNKNLTNENAILLALINAMYESHFNAGTNINIATPAIQTSSDVYTKSDILDIISFMHVAVKPHSTAQH